MPRFWGGMVIGVSHLVAAASDWIVLTTLALIGAGLCAASLMYAALEDMDGPPPLFVPLLVVLLAIGACCLSTVTALILTITGICAGTARRPLRIPFPAVPFLLVVLTACVWLLATLLGGTAFFDGLHDALIGSLVIGVLFCIYWIPLAFSESILRIAAAIGYAVGRRLPWQQLRAKCARLIRKATT